MMFLQSKRFMKREQIIVLSENLIKMHWSKWRIKQNQKTALSQNLNRLLNHRLSLIKDLKV